MVPNQRATSAQDRFSFMLFMLFNLSFRMQERCFYYNKIFSYLAVLSILPDKRQHCSYLEIHEMERYSGSLMPSLSSARYLIVPQ